LYGTAEAVPFQNVAKHEFFSNLLRPRLTQLSPQSGSYKL